MMRKIDRTGGAFSRRSPEKALRRLLGAAVVVLMLCLVLAVPVTAAPGAFSITSVEEGDVLIPGTGLIVRWSAADGADGYKISVRDLTTDEVLISNYDRGTKRTYSLSSSDLIPGHDYRIAVCAYSSSGDTWVERCFSVGDAPTINAVYSTPSSGSAGTTFSFTIWANEFTYAAGIEIDGYSIGTSDEYLYIDGQNVFVIEHVVTSPGTNREVIAYPYDGSEKLSDGSASTTITVLDAPSAGTPTIETPTKDAIHILGEDLTVTWSAPPTNPDCYTTFLYYNGEIIYQDTVEETTSVTLPGKYFANYGTYSIEVYAAKKGYSEDEPGNVFITIESSKLPAGVPVLSIPSATGTYYVNDDLKVSWSSPATNPDGYYIWLYGGGMSEGILFDDISGTSYTIPGENFANAGLYSIEVYAEKEGYIQDEPGNVLFNVQIRPSYTANAVVDAAKGWLGKTPSEIRKSDGTRYWAEGNNWCSYFIGAAADKAGASSIFPKMSTMASCGYGFKWFAEHDALATYFATGPTYSYTKNGIESTTHMYAKGGGTYTSAQSYTDYQPEVGDLVYFLFEHDAGDIKDYTNAGYGKQYVTFSHVELVSEVNSDYITTVAGNSGSGTTETRKVVEHKLNWKTGGENWYGYSAIVAYARPNYAEVTEESLPTLEKPTITIPAVNTEIYPGQDLTVSWTTTGTEPTKYIVQVFREGEMVDSWDTNSKTLTIPSSNLNILGEYSIDIYPVRAGYDANVWSSTYFSVVSPVGDFSINSPSLDSSFTDDSDITVSWSKASSATGYLFSLRDLTTDQIVNDFNQKDIGNVQSYVISPEYLTAGHEYQVAIGAYNTQGTYWEEQTFSIDDAENGAKPSTFSVMHTITYSQENDNTQVDIFWGSAFREKGYNVTLHDITTNKEIVSDVDLGISNRYTIPQNLLVEGHDYEVIITAYNDHGETKVKHSFTYSIRVDIQFTSDVNNGKSTDGLYFTLSEHTAVFSTGYDDRYFISSNSEYNHELAKLSLGLSAAAFTAGNTEYTEYYSNGERERNLADAYTKMGFADVEYYNYDIGLDDASNKAAYSIAKKDTVIDGESVSIYSIVIRGKGYGAEWASNFDFGSGLHATGFSEPAEDIYQNLKETLRKANTESEVKIWITGFGRGGAIANLLAAELDRDAASLNVDKSGIYAYTFATMQCVDTTHADYSNDVTDYSNIFNIVNPSDIFSSIPFSSWGYGRYGNTYYFDYNQDEDLYKYIPQEYTNLVNDYASYTPINQEAAVAVLDIRLGQIFEGKSQYSKIHKDYVKSLFEIGFHDTNGDIFGVLLFLPTKIEELYSGGEEAVDVAESIIENTPSISMTDYEIAIVNLVNRVTCSDAASYDITIMLLNVIPYITDLDTDNANTNYYVKQSKVIADAGMDLIQLGSVTKDLSGLLNYYEAPKGAIASTNTIYTPELFDKVLSDLFNETISSIKDLSFDMVIKPLLQSIFTENMLTGLVAIGELSEHSSSTSLNELSKIYDVLNVVATLSVNHANVAAMPKQNYVEVYMSWLLAADHHLPSASPDQIYVTTIPTQEAIKEMMVDVIVQSDGHGTVSGSQKAVAGTTVLIDAYPDSGYAFAGWYDESGVLVSSDAHALVSVDAKPTFIAKFKIAKPTLEPDISWYEQDKNAATFSISTGNQLLGLANLVNSGTSFENKIIDLNADIDLTHCANWIPIGTENRPFKGKFFGNGHVISNLTVIQPEMTGVGLFGTVYGQSEVCGVGILNFTIVGNNNVGSLVGFAESRSLGAIVSECLAYNGTVAGNYSVGGLIGGGDGTLIISCMVVSVDVSGIGVGGLAASLDGISSYYYGESSSEVMQCMVIGGAITGNNSVGGLVGGSSPGGVVDSLNIYNSIVLADSIVGDNADGAISFCGVSNSGVGKIGVGVWDMLPINNDVRYGDFDQNGGVIYLEDFWNNQTWWEERCELIFGYDGNVGHESAWAMGSSENYKIPYLRDFPMIQDASCAFANGYAENTKPGNFYLSSPSDDEVFSDILSIYSSSLSVYWFESPAADSYIVSLYDKTTSVEAFELNIDAESYDGHIYIKDDSLTPGHEYLLSVTAVNEYGTTVATAPRNITVLSVAEALAKILDADVSGNTVTLTKNVSITEPICISLEENEELILTTTGNYTILRECEDDNLFTINSGTLTIKGKDANNLLIIDGNKDRYTSEYLNSLAYLQGGNLRLSEYAVLTNNYAEDGCVNVQENSILYITGGSITGNEGVNAGAIQNFGTIIMSDGLISENTAEWCGGISNSGVFKMSDGEISYNSVTNQYGTGGVNVAGGEFIMTGGSISQNTGYNSVEITQLHRHTEIDGIWYENVVVGKFYISGDAVIPASDKVFIHKNTTGIMVTGPLSKDAGVYNIDIGRTTGVVVDATEAKISGKDLLPHFVLNKNGYTLEANGNCLVFPGSNPTPTPDKPAAPTLTEPESLPADAKIKTNTVAETNAATKAEVGYQVKPTEVTKLTAPTITRGKLSVQLNEGVKVVKTLSDGKTVEVEATVNEDGSINLPSGALDDAAAVTVNFIGRQFGDVTNDGKPDTLDAARVLQASVGLFDFSGADTFYGDVSGDGLANTLDAARILQYSVSLVDENYVTKA